MSGARNLHCDEACKSTNSKGADCTQFLARGHIALSELLDGSIAPEPCGRIGSLPRGGRHKPLEEGFDPPLAEHDARAMEEATHARGGRFTVVDPIGVSLV